MNNYKVSVVIPIFNSENTIQKCIDSVLTQTLDSVQMILVDDGSTDFSTDIIDKYAEEDNVKVIHQQNAGVSAARNKGIELADGEYLFFLDSDDFLESDVLQKMWEYGSKHDLDLVSCSHTEFNATIYNGNENNSESFIASNNDEIGQHFCDIFPKCVWAKLFKKEIIDKEKIRFPVGMQLGEDMYFTYSFLTKLKCMGKVSNVFYRVQNVNPVSLSKRYVSNIEDDIIKQISLWNRLISKFPQAEITFYKENVDIYIGFSAMFFNNLYKQDCSLNHTEKKQIIKKYLKDHKDWLVHSGTGIKKPKNKLQKITTIVIKTQSPFLIGLFFKTKEQLKKRKFEQGRIK